MSKVLTTLIVVLLLQAMPLQAIAQDEATPSAAGNTAQVQIILRPIDKLDGERFEVEIQPGSSTSLTVVVGNAGEVPLNLIAYTSDIRTKVNGGLAINPEGSEQTEPTTWMTFPTETYSIEPGYEVQREFEVAVPEGTEPGQYVIPIAVETVDSFEIEGNAQIRQKVRKIIPVYVTVPGDIQGDFEFGEPSIVIDNRSAAIQVPIVNTGDTTLRLAGTMTLKDLSGGVLLDGPIEMAAFYRRDETIVQARLDAPLPAGDYLLSLELTDAVTSVSHGFSDVTVTMPEQLNAETNPILFQNILIAPNADPIQFASVAVEIANIGSVQQSTRLTLIVTRDGEPVEDFVVAENLALGQGVTTVTQRYIPLNGWESGTYSFSLKLESTQGETSAVLLTQNDVATLQVP